MSRAASLPVVSVLLSLLLLSTQHRVAHAKVRQVLVIFRHGARKPLDKHPFDPSTESFVAREPLFDEGSTQLKRLGEFLRTQYIEPSSAGSRRLSTSVLINDDLTASRVLSFSSNFARTVTSAKALLGTFVPKAQIPTLVFNGSQSDWLLRGYAICPKLHSQFRAFVNTDKEYQERARLDADFVAEKAALLGLEGDDRNFENIFNIHDQFLLRRYYNYNPTAEKTILPDEEMERLTSAADWYESRKFHYGTHRTLVAGGLLRDIIRRLKAASTKLAEPAVVLYAAHYPTLLTLLATIRSTTQSKPLSPADSIPGFGAALIIELWEPDPSQSGSMTIKLRWWKGATNEALPTISAVDIPLGRPPCTDVSASCSMADIERIFASDTLGEGQFCDDCKSESPVCLNSGSRRTESSEVDGGGLASCSGGSKATLLSIGACVGLIAGLVFALVYNTVSARRKQRFIHDMGTREGLTHPFEDDGAIRA